MSEDKMDFKKMFESTLVENITYYQVGDSVKFTQEDVSQYNKGVEIGFDYGKIVALKGQDYMVKLDNGNEIMVKNMHAYAFGNADADAS